MRIGVLALQGAFREHLDTLHAIGVEGVRVREPADLAGVSGLILPGGESTTMRQLIERWGLHQPILDLADRGAPIFGTCAGMIVLAPEIAGGEPPILPLLDVTVERNAFGRQLDSFEAELDVPILGDTPVHAVFIRAPIIERTGPDVDVLARLDDGRIVAVRQRNIIATAFHPELAGETRFHRLVATMAAEHDDPGEGSGRRPHPTRRSLAGPPTEAGPSERLPPPRSTGKVRAARLTDLAALGELSRLCQSDGADTRSLGLPVNGPPIGVFSLFRLPLGAFRPNDLMFVYEEEGRIAGLVRVERESVRDEWTIVELDAVGMANAGDIRYRLVQQLLREGAKRAAARFHVACADADGNVEAAHAGRVHALRRGAGPVPGRRTGPCRKPWADERAAGCRIRPTTSLDALPLARLYARATPAPVARLEAIRLADWERQGTHWRVPRSSLTPILRFADVEGFVQASADGGKDGTQLDAFLQIGVAKEDQPHYLKIIARPEADVADLLDFGLGVIAARTTKGGDHRHDHGVIAPVRTYESPIDRRLEEAGFDSIASVNLLMKETLVRVAEPALVPAGVR